jgi:hypothetical protein
MSFTAEVAAQAVEPDAGNASAVLASEAEKKDPSVKEIRAECHANLKAKGLKGDDLRKAVSACIVIKRPGQAKREQCRMEGVEKGMRKDELGAYVKNCIKS